MTKKMRELLAKKEAAVKQARAITAAADAAGRDLTDEEAAQHADIVASLDRLNASIKSEEILAAAETSLELSPEARISGGAPMLMEDPKRGFKSFGEFTKAVAAVSTDHHIDERLRFGAAAPSTFGGEGTGADGGFMVPPEFGREVWSLSTSLDEGSLVPLTDNMPITGNSMVFPSEETTPWGTDGVRAYWEGEAAAATATKPKLQPNTLRMNKLTALVPVSEELMADAPAISAFLTRKAGESIRYKTNDAIVNGDGAGKPLGIYNSAALIQQAKEASQTADTINANNVAKMFGRMLPGSISRSVWLLNPDAFNQLITMTVGNSPIWTPPQSGMRDSPAGRLLGRPVILTETARTLGDVGDIILADFGSYRTLTKQGGIETATSMHLYFDAAAMAFRFIFRVAGQPIVKSAITPPHSAVTKSPYVALAERA